jgi:hypothetical protein
MTEENERLKQQLAEVKVAKEKHERLVSNRE